MKAEIELNDGRKYAYEDVERIDDSNGEKITIYKFKCVLASFNKDELKSLFTEE
jgi:hypothetical protein